MLGFAELSPTYKIRIIGQAPSGVFYSLPITLPGQAMGAGKPRGKLRASLAALAKRRPDAAAP